MDETYNIDEILSAVDELSNLKSRKKNINSEKNSNEITSANIPKNTLKLIEEAEDHIVRKT